MSKVNIEQREISERSPLFGKRPDMDSIVGALSIGSEIVLGRNLSLYAHVVRLHPLVGLVQVVEHLRSTHNLPKPRPMLCRLVA